MSSRDYLYQGIYYVGNLLAVALMISKALTFDYVDFNSKYQQVFLWAGPEDLLQVAFLPKALDQSPVFLAFGSALVFFLLSFRIIWYYRREYIRHKLPTRIQCIELCLLAGTNMGFAVVALIAMISARVKSHHVSDIFRFNTNREGTTVYSGTFDMLTWTCDMAHLITKEESRKGHRIFSQQCEREKVGTGLLITFLFFVLLGSICTIAVTRRPAEEVVQESEDINDKVKEDWESDRTAVV